MWALPSSVCVIYYNTVSSKVNRLLLNPPSFVIARHSLPNITLLYSQDAVSTFYQWWTFMTSWSCIIAVFVTTPLLSFTNVISSVHLLNCYRIYNKDNPMIMSESLYIYCNCKGMYSNFIALTMLNWKYARTVWSYQNWVAKLFLPCLMTHGAAVASAVD